MSSLNIKKLQSAYAERRLFPFLGAGLSAPFKVPSWGRLINEIANECVPNTFIPAIEQCNADDRLKSMATGTIRSNNEDGVAKFLVQHFSSE